MNKIIILFLLSLLFLSGSVFACSKKDQLNIVFTGHNNNVSHDQTRKLGKSLFADALLTEELHTFTIDMNQAKGTLIFDINDQKQARIILEKINDYLKQNQLKLVRSSYEKLLEKN